MNAGRFAGPRRPLSEIRGAPEQTSLHANDASCEMGVDLAEHVGQEGIDGSADRRVETGAQPEPGVQRP